MAYSLDLVTIGRDIAATPAVWYGVIEGTARDTLGEVEYEETDDGSDRQDAEQFLRDLLADGPVPSR